MRYDEDAVTGLITTTIQDQLTDTTFQVVSKYLCGADGAASPVARQLGLEFNTLTGGGLALNAWYEADLSHIYRKDPGMLHAVLTPHIDAPLWSIHGMNRLVRPHTEFVMSMLAHPSATSINVTDEQVIQRLREYIGDDTVDIKLKEYIVGGSMSHTPKQSARATFSAWATPSTVIHLARVLV